jgi:hypothetical protein
MGLKEEHCFCAELSPESHEKVYRDGVKHMTVGSLWHIHGGIRFANQISYSDCHSVMAPLMGKTRGAEDCWFKRLWDRKGFIKYCVKDAMKNYLEGGNRRLLMSRGWYPPGFRKVEKILKTWAWWHGAGWHPSADFTNYSLGEYVPFAWEVMHSLLMEWAAGRSIRLEMKDSLIWIQRQDIEEWKVVKHED